VARTCGKGCLLSRCYDKTWLELVKPLRTLYGTMADNSWSLIWKAVDRERKRPEAASVTRRTREDRIAYAGHLSWMAGPAQGRRKTRLSPCSAAMRLNDYERAHATLLAEEAIDDPLRMATDRRLGSMMAATGLLHLRLLP
jgi:hypothetical protein